MNLPAKRKRKNFMIPKTTIVCHLLIPMLPLLTATALQWLQLWRGRDEGAEESKAGGRAGGDGRRTQGLCAVVVVAGCRQAESLFAYCYSTTA